jgi:hypothetical protein
VAALGVVVGEVGALADGCVEVIAGARLVVIGGAVEVPEVVPQPVIMKAATSRMTNGINSFFTVLTPK